MSSTIRNSLLKVTNMTCAHCESAIENELLKNEGILSVNAKYSSGKVQIVYDENIILLSKIIEIIEETGYHVQNEKQSGETGAKNSPSKSEVKQSRDYSDIVAVGVIIFAIYMLGKRFGLFNIIYQFPVAKEGMGYGMLFLIGLLTSIHCVAMCGGICLSQCVSTDNTNKPVNKWRSLQPSLLYNLGRVVSYTVIGGVVGALGSVISFSGAMKGFVQILAGAFMVIMGINMLGIFPSLRKFNPRMPKIFARKIYEQKQSRSPLYIGLLNGLMPCGPLQAMQLYALSTASPIKGALSMLIFSVGTVPLLFAFGAISSFLSKKFTNKMMTVSAVLVITLGLFMFSYGANLSGITLPGATNSTATIKTENIAKVEDGIQTVTTGLASGRYEPIVVQKGIPVRWVIQAKQGDINGCNNAIVISKFGITKKLKLGDNVIEFTPDEEGVVKYSCWMGMIRSSITVVDDVKNINTKSLPKDNSNQSSGGCCANSGNDIQDSGNIEEGEADTSQSDLEQQPSDQNSEAQNEDLQSLLGNNDSQNNQGNPADNYDSQEDLSDLGGGCCN